MDGGRAVIFDCDGVLVDSEVLAFRAAVDLLARYGVEIALEPAIERFMGRPLASLIETLSEEHDVDLNQGFAEDMRAAVMAKMATDVQAVAGMNALLGNLKVLKCVASSSDSLRVRTALTTAGLIGHFNGHVYTTENVTRPKPAPDLFVYGAAQLGVDAARCIVVEDSKAGVQAAVAGGMTAIGFTGGSHAKGAHFAAGLRDAGVHEVAIDAASLNAILDRLLAQPA